LETDGAVIGPGHAGILFDHDRFWLSLHFYDGAQRGMSSLAIRPLSWEADGWPKVGEEIRSSFLTLKRPLIDP